MGAAAICRRPNTAVAPAPAPTHIQGGDTIAMVIVVARHGARYPCKNFPKDLSWPSLGSFWEDYSGVLSPTGSHQHKKLGHKLLYRYRRCSDLFSGVDGCIGSVIETQSSPMQRCLMSASSFLEGFCPGVPHHFAYFEDKHRTNIKNVSDNLVKNGMALGVPIHILNPDTKSNKLKDLLFHQAATARKEAKTFKKSEFKRSEFLRSMAEDVRVHELCDKLYKATGYEALAPKGPDELERIGSVKTVVAQISIAKAHGMPVIPNEDMIKITDEDELLMSKITEERKRCLFNPASSDKVSDGIGRDCAGFLGNEIAQQLSGRIEGLHDKRFVMYSAHDGNLMALASLLGLDIEAPAFTGHFFFELHKPADSMSGWSIGVGYVPDPTVLSEDDYVELKTRVLPLDDKYRKYKDCANGAGPAQALLDYLGHPGLTHCSSLLHKIMLDGVLEGSLGRVGEPTLLTDEQRARCKDAFELQDVDSTGTVSASQLTSLFCAIGLTEYSRHVTEHLVKFMSKDMEAEISYDEFLAMVQIWSECDPKRAARA